MKPERVYRQLQKLMARRDAAIPPAGASRDSPEFAAFLRAEREVGVFLDRRDRALAVLREPAEGVTVCSPPFPRQRPPDRTQVMT